MQSRQELPSSPSGSDTIPASPVKTPLSPCSQRLAKGKRQSPEISSEQGSGKWTDEEHKRFLEALDLYGNCWKKVEEHVGTRTCAQIRSHCQKYFRRMRNKALQELKRTNQLQGKVFIVTKEYFNYSGCTHQPIEPSIKAPIRLSNETGSTKSEDQKDHFDLISSPCQELEQEPRFEIFEEPKLMGGELDEGLFGSPFNFCEENMYPVMGNELAFRDDYEEYGLPFLARVPYEA